MKDSLLMDRPQTLTLAERALEGIAAHAGEAFPEECCGVILADATNDQVHRLTNIQNRLHALDPETYPRTAAIAYAMDPKELERVIQDGELSGRKLKAFYHSHPDHDAYFSDEDKAFASPFGQPTFPSAAQIVVSIYSGAIRQIRAFVWSEQSKDFVEVHLKKI